MKRILVKIAKDAGKLLLENFGKVEKAKILKKKGAYDYSIIADRLAEENILNELNEAGIKCRIITEERGAIGPKSSNVLFIDPLDGTLNYSNGIPHFCVSLALQSGKEVVLSVIYDPCRRELFFAEKNKGAFLNGKKIRVSSKRELKDAFCGLAFNYSDFKKSLRLEEGIRKAVWKVRIFGCASLNFAWLACGRQEGYVDLSLKPWDIAPGALLVEEAGGKVTDVRGKRWHPFCKEIVATNGAIHQKLLKVVRGK